MKNTNCLFILIFLFSFSIHLWAEGGKPAIEKQPLWVTTTAVNYTATSLDDEAEDGYADLHFEKQISLQQQATFVKKAIHILSETGLQNQSQVSVDYDPSYQQLCFHTIRIIRGNEVI